MLAICERAVYKAYKFFKKFSFGDNNEKRYSP
jgi:hypothetical protein